MNGFELLPRCDDFPHRSSLLCFTPSDSRNLRVRKDRRSAEAPPGVYTQDECEWGLLAESALVGVSFGFLFLLSRGESEEPGL